MLRSLYNGPDVSFLTPGVLADEVLGEDHWLFCQGVGTLAGAWALRCQAGHYGLIHPDGSLGAIYQCGALATRAPDGEALCGAHMALGWSCCRCGAQLPMRCGGVYYLHGFYCDACVAAHFRCARCGERPVLLDTPLQVLLCAGCHGYAERGG